MAEEQKMSKIAPAAAYDRRNAMRPVRLRHEKGKASQESHGDEAQ